jgi:hypothetical protein
MKVAVADLIQLAIEQANNGVESLTKAISLARATGATLA